MAETKDIVVVEMTTSTIDSTYGHLTEGDTVAVPDEVAARWLALGIAKPGSGKPTKTVQAGETETPPPTQEEAQDQIKRQELYAAELHGDTAAARARTLTAVGPVPPIDEEPSGGPQPPELPSPQGEARAVRRGPGDTRPADEPESRRGR